MTQDELRSFLASTAVFRDAAPERLEEIAGLCRVLHAPAGELVLRQGGPGDGVYFLRSGQLAVRIQRGGWRDTVAYLQAPNVFGELSLITGRPCVADVEVVIDADMVLLPKDALPPGTPNHDVVMKGLTRVVAERLQETVIRGARAPESPAVLLHNHPHWEAPRAFAEALARSLARQTGRRTLLVNLHESGDGATRALDGGAEVCEFAARAGDTGLRGRAAQQLTVWKSRYENLILNPLGPGAAAIAEAIDDFANFHGDLCGPGDPLAEEANDRFLVQSAAQPTLPRLSGSRQLAPGAAEAETARHAGAPAPGAFLRTVDSIARRVAGLQVGIALGGGAAWGWAHIGVLQVLENAGIPIDVITGCSMGSVIGAFRSTGRSVAELTEIAEYWRTRTKRFIEWRFWRMCLISEKMVRKTFRGYFGDRTVNQTAIPYWANAVDIQTGKEFTIQDGSLIDCIRASIALPGLLPPFSTDGHLLVDAGITDPVPVHLVRTMGCQYAIAVNAMAELQAQPVRRRYPFNAFDVMTRCMFVMGHEIGQARAEQVADVVFTPNLGSITLLEFDRSPEIIECGRRAAEAMLPQIVAGYDKLKSRLAPALARQAG